MMMKTQIDKILKLEINKILANNDSDTDMVFDKLYFYQVIKTRYEKEVQDIIDEKKFNFVKDIFSYELKKYMECLKSSLKENTKSVYEKSQDLFNYIGLAYLFYLENRTAIELSEREIELVNSMLGYSYIFDYMINFWASEMSLKIKKAEVKPRNKEEETYIYTHFFLTQSKYLKVEIDTENYDELIKNVNYVIDNNLEDLIAELLWAITYFRGTNDEVAKKLFEKMMNDMKVDYLRNNRKDEHIRFSRICALLEIKRKMNGSHSLDRNNV